MLTLAAGALQSAARDADAGDGPVSVEIGNQPKVAPGPAGTRKESALGRRISWVRYQPAWLRNNPAILAPGDILTGENLSAAMQAMTRAATRRAESLGTAMGNPSLAFTYVTPEYDLTPEGSSRADSVGVTLHLVYVALPVGDMGSQVLPIPRALPPDLFAPTSILSALPVKLVVTQDRTVGVSVGARSAFRFGGGTNPPPFRLEAGGAQSLDESFHSGDAALRFVRERGSGIVREVTGAVEAGTVLEPRGPAEFHANTVGISGGITLAVRTGARLSVDVRYAQAREKFAGTTGAVKWTTVHEQGNRILYEAIPPRLFGFFRAAIWEENLRTPSQGAAQRLVARVGYAKEFPVGVNQSIGFEVVAGAGRSWGQLDEPRRFFGGGGQGEFLYESNSSPLLEKAPDGPLLRSMGRAQAGFRGPGAELRGGTEFRHLNLNVTLPIPRWSYPLIPNETADVPGPDGSPLTLKQILVQQIDRTGPNMLQASLQESDHLPPEEAERRAAEVFGEIRPAAHFIIEQANIFALKPLLLLDCAELRAGPEKASWLAAGAGMQLTIVTAKLEVGYMRTLRGPTFGSRGNLFARLGFERLF